MKVCKQWVAIHNHQDLVAVDCQNIEIWNMQAQIPCPVPSIDKAKTFWRHLVVANSLLQLVFLLHNNIFMLTRRNWAVENTHNLPQAPGDRHGV
jgi:hypothetical protein